MRVFCVLKKSREYDVDYVEHLKAGVSRHLPDVPFVCIDGSEWPGWWCKMELFRPGIAGDILYFDLDTVIVGDLTEIASVGCFTMLSDFFHPHRLASGVMYLPEKDRAAIWDAWISDPDGVINHYRGWGDGGFLNDLVPGAARWQDVRPGQVVSYKAHILKTGLPKDARVVCFHGRPRPRAVNWKI